MHPSHSAQLSLHGVTKRYGERTVLHRISLALAPGEKAGVVGDNGAGKSTLLRLLAGRETPDAGEVSVVSPGGTGYLAQAIGLTPHATVQDAVDVALGELRTLEAELRRAGSALAGASAGPELDAALASYARLTEQYEARDGYGADTRVDTAMHGLGLPWLSRDRPLGTLSGGERSRLALAATLASCPELLLLDEPTNDLDDRGSAGWRTICGPTAERSSRSPTTASSWSGSPARSWRSKAAGSPVTATATPDTSRPRPRNAGGAGSGTTSGGPNSTAAAGSPSPTWPVWTPSRAGCRRPTSVPGRSAHGGAPTVR